MKRYRKEHLAQGPKLSFFQIRARIPILKMRSGSPPTAISLRRPPFLPRYLPRPCVPLRPALHPQEIPLTNMTIDKRLGELLNLVVKEGGSDIHISPAGRRCFESRAHLSVAKYQSTRIEGKPETMLQVHRPARPLGLVSGAPDHRPLPTRKVDRVSASTATARRERSRSRSSSCRATSTFAG